MDAVRGRRASPFIKRWANATCGVLIVPIEVETLTLACNVGTVIEGANVSAFDGVAACSGNARAAW